MVESQDEIKLAQDVQGQVNSAESTVEESARLKEQLKQEMLNTIEQMRAATQRIGPYGAQVGSGDRSAFILRVPIPSESSMIEGGRSYPFHTYIVATTGGFIGLKKLSGERGTMPYFSEQDLIMAITTTQNGRAQLPKDRWRDEDFGFVKPPNVAPTLNTPIPGSNTLISHGQTTGDFFVDVTRAEVNLALQTSIDHAQAPFKASSITANTNLKTAASVRNELQSK